MRPRREHWSRGGTISLRPQGRSAIQGESGGQGSLPNVAGAARVDASRIKRLTQTGKRGPGTTREKRTHRRQDEGHEQNSRSNFERGRRMSNTLTEARWGREGSARLHREGLLKKKGKVLGKRKSHGERPTQTMIVSRQRLRPPKRHIAEAGTLSSRG